MLRLTLAALAAVFCLLLSSCKSTTEEKVIDFSPGKKQEIRAIRLARAVGMPDLPGDLKEDTSVATDASALGASQLKRRLAPRISATESESNSELRAVARMRHFVAAEAQGETSPLPVRKAMLLLDESARNQALGGPDPAPEPDLRGRAQG
jgi:hypothetical protein